MWTLTKKCFGIAITDGMTHVKRINHSTIRLSKILPTFLNDSMRMKDMYVTVAVFAPIPIYMVIPKLNMLHKNPTELAVLAMYSNMLLKSVNIQNASQNISATDKFNRSILKGVIGTHFVANAASTKVLPTMPKIHSISIRVPKSGPTRSLNILEVLEESFIATYFQQQSKSYYSS